LGLGNLVCYKYPCIGFHSLQCLLVQNDLCFLAKCKHLHLYIDDYYLCWIYVSYLRLKGNTYLTLFVNNLMRFQNSRLDLKLHQNELYVFDQGLLSRYLRFFGNCLAHWNLDLCKKKRVNDFIRLVCYLFLLDVLLCYLLLIALVCHFFLNLKQVYILEIILFMKNRESFSMKTLRFHYLLQKNLLVIIGVPCCFCFDFHLNRFVCLYLILLSFVICFMRYPYLEYFFNCLFLIYAKLL
jgi:hypothetical protein